LPESEPADRRFFKGRKPALGSGTRLALQAPLCTAFSRKGGATLPAKNRQAAPEKYRINIP